MTMTRAQAFEKELRALLDKYEVDLTASDEYGGYAECGKDIQIRVEFPWSDEEFEATGDSMYEIKFGDGIYRCDTPRTEGE